MKMNAGLTAKVTRGQESWAYIYVALGFAVTIEGTIVSMITPLNFPWNLIAYGFASAVTFYLFLGNRWFLNKLIGSKIKYENASR